MLGQGDLEPVVRRSGVPLHCLGRRRAYGALFALRAAHAIARADFDLIQVFLPGSLFYAALAKFVWRARARLMYTELSSRPRKGFKSVLHHWSLRQCDLYAANSRGSQEYLEQTGADPAKIRLIPNGHVVPRYRQMSSTRQAVRDSLGVTADQTLAVFVGRLIPSKRVVDLLDAVALLRQTQPLLRAALVGEGPEQGSLRQHAAVLGITDRVIFAGRRLDIPDLLQASDLFVFPSETEGLSNAVIEAALVGLPIVACDIGGVREIVLDGKGAYLVPCRQPQALAAEIARVLDQPDEARRRAQLAQQLAEREFSIESVNRRLYQVYHEVLHA